MTKAAIFAVYIFISLLGLYQLKAAELVVLRWFPLSIAFPLAAGTIIVGTQIVGALLLNEQFDAISLIAVSFILIGLTILGSIDAIRGAI